MKKIVKTIFIFMIAMTSLIGCAEEIPVPNLNPIKDKEVLFSIQNNKGETFSRKIICDIAKEEITFTSSVPKFLAESTNTEIYYSIADGERGLYPTNLDIKNLKDINKIYFEKLSSLVESVNNNEKYTLKIKGKSINNSEWIMEVSNENLPEDIQIFKDEENEIIKNFIDPKIEEPEIPEEPIVPEVPNIPETPTYHELDKVTFLFEYTNLDTGRKMMPTKFMEVKISKDEITFKDLPLILNNVSSASYKVSYKEKFNSRVQTSEGYVEKNNLSFNFVDKAINDILINDGIERDYDITIFGANWSLRASSMENLCFEDIDEWAYSYNYYLDSLSKPEAKPEPEVSAPQLDPETPEPEIPAPQPETPEPEVTPKPEPEITEPPKENPEVPEIKVPAAPGVINTSFRFTYSKLVDGKPEVENNEDIYTCNVNAIIEEKENDLIINFEDFINETFIPLTVRVSEKNTEIPNSFFTNNFKMEGKILTITDSEFISKFKNVINDFDNYRVSITLKSKDEKYYFELEKSISKSKTYCIADLSYKKTFDLAGAFTFERISNAGNLIDPNGRGEEAVIKIYKENLGEGTYTENYKATINTKNAYGKMSVSSIGIIVNFPNLAVSKVADGAVVEKIEKEVKDIGSKCYRLFGTTKGRVITANNISSNIYKNLIQERKDENKLSKMFEVLYIEDPTNPENFEIYISKQALNYLENHVAEGQEVEAKTTIFYLIKNYVEGMKR